MNKVIKVLFEKEEYFKFGIRGLKQWNHSQQLAISGLDISDEIVEVHFSLQERDGTAKRMVGTVIDGILRVDIPAFILEGPEWSSEYYSAYAWIYLSDEESAETVRKIEFTIEARPKPDEYVKPEEPDTFIEQIKKIMNETKEIAQSVRDDADNGEFNGEKGEKGDAGSIKFVIVDELPTENIDTSAIYLLPFTEAKKDEDENLVFNNNFHEYIYVDGAWERIGSATVEVNLDDYVKKTDYATKDKAGVAYIYSTADKSVPGVGLSGSNILGIVKATNTEIDEKTNNSKPIVPSNLDYAVMKALSDSKLEWTDEQKQLARTQLGAIGSNNVHADNGLAILGNGQLIISPPIHSLINDRNKNDAYSQRRAVTLSVLDYAVKKALSDCKLEGDDVWTDEEKAKALELLGGLQKIVSTGSFQRVYAIGQDGVNKPLNTSENPFSSALVLFDAGGCVKVNVPTKDNHATTKKYVDDLVTSAKDSIALKDASTGQVYNVRINNGTLEMVLVDEEVE